MILKVADVLRLLYHRPTDITRLHRKCWTNRLCKQYRCVRECVRGLRLGTPRAGRRALWEEGSSHCAEFPGQRGDVKWSGASSYPHSFPCSSSGVCQARQTLPKGKTGHLSSGPWIRQDNLPQSFGVSTRVTRGMTAPTASAFSRLPVAPGGEFLPFTWQCSPGWEFISRYTPVPPEQGQLKPLILKPNKSKLLQKVTSPYWPRTIF